MLGDCKDVCHCMQKHGPKAVPLDSIPFIDSHRTSQGKSGDDVWHFIPMSSVGDRIKHGHLGMLTPASTKHSVVEFVEELTVVKAQDAAVAKAAKKKDFDCRARKARILHGRACKHWCDKVLVHHGIPHQMEHWVDQKWIELIEEV